MTGPARTQSLGLVVGALEGRSTDAPDFYPDERAVPVGAGAFRPAARDGYAEHFAPRSGDQPGAARVSSCTIGCIASQYVGPGPS